MTSDEIIRLLNEQLKWIKVSSYMEVKSVLNSVLDSDTKKIIYSLSDGKMKSTEVIKKAKSSPNTVSKCWNEWSAMGIGETISATGGGRFKKLFELKDFGINVPKVSINKDK